MTWTLVETIADAIDCAIVFDGIYTKRKETIEFTTEATPWLVYLTSAGEVKAGLLGDSYETVVGANVTAMSTVRGIRSKYGDVDQGLMLFYIIAGEIKYREYIDGVWGDQYSVDIAPADAVKLKSDRTFDWRIVLHVTDNTGALYEVFSKAYFSGWTNIEHLSASTLMTVDVYEVAYIDTRSDDDHLSATANVSVTVLWGISPVFTEASNVANGDSDYGYLVRLVFDHDVSSVVGNDTAFLMTDSTAVQFNSTAVSQISAKEIEVTFQNFNNAIGEVSVAYTPGTMLGEAGQSVDADTIAFTPTGLVPFEVDPPVPLSIINIVDWSIE